MEDNFVEKVANLKFKEIKEVFSHVPVSEKASTMTSIQIVDDIEKDSFYFRALEQENIMLNQNQIDAVRQTDGPLLIIAGAGTGKTTVLISRIGYMLTVKKIPASNILLVTYTKKAANEGGFEIFISSLIVLSAGKLLSLTSHDCL